MLPTRLNFPTLRAEFVGEGRTLAGDLVRAGDTLTLRKPLEAPPTGQVIFSDGARKLATVSYQALNTAIDVAINVPYEAFPFRVEPAETTASDKSRLVRVQPGTSLKLVIPEGNTILGDVTVAEDGQVGSINGVIAGSRAALRLDVQPIQLDLQGVKAPVRVGPFETQFVTGNRLVWIPPGINCFLAIGAESIRIENIAVATDGTVSQSQGQVRTQKGTLTPVIRSLRVEAGEYTGTWRLRRYETGFASGSRDIPVLAADRQLTINFGNFDLETPPFDPDTVTGALSKAGSALRFNVMPMVVDPGEMAAPFAVQPFETGFSSGRRTIQVPRVAATGNVALVSGGDTTGPFQISPDGTLSSTSHGLITTSSSVRLNVLSVRVESANSLRPYRIMPFEVNVAPGSRTIAMVRGQNARVESQGESYPVTIGSDGTLSSNDRHVTVVGGALSLNWSP